ncbi:diaminobutyrate--2-oxoglutarate aminotransferase [Xanthomonas oryzae]|uniref:Diaminobutyrate--2-oxoglutarate aminotransferase n=1 Tax=Xanthomonas oryzae TaxID=347 RepID=A0AAP0ZI32_9XANT|nr:aspartate aminotransferase family protein [Xanthomonas oryzae]KOR39353.1 diaminobutyrate--2-oxoglutarate aminotransferase [Xanthomonas oryzae]QBG83823.1 aspartate aminotransferase family protein [Xanthomonas oryzae]
MIDPRQLFQHHESNVRSYCRAFDALFVRGAGSELFDVQGRRYIDFLAGCGALNYGHNDPDMTEALVAHLRGGGLAMSLDLHSQTKHDFIDNFVALILRPRGLPHRLQFTGPTGANAIEAALKLARKRTGRHNIIAFSNAYHGLSMGALAATGNRHHRMDLLHGGVTRLPYDDYLGSGLDSAALLEAMLDDPSSGIDPPAAIVLELVQGEGGLNVASTSWLHRVFATARRHGALTIVDDIQAGCGRCGNFFSFDDQALVPDLITLSKSLSGFGLPFSLLLVAPEHDSWRPGEHTGTFRGNNHAMLTATVALRKFWADDALRTQIDKRGQILAQALTRMTAHVPEARIKGRGMFVGLDLRTRERAASASAHAFGNGLVIETAGARGEVVKVMAPLTTPDALLREGLEILSDAVVSACG